MEQHFLNNFSFLLRSMLLGVLVACLYWKRDKIVWHCLDFFLPGKVFQEYVLVRWLSCTHLQQTHDVVLHHCHSCVSAWRWLLLLIKYSLISPCIALRAFACNSPPISLSSTPHHNKTKSCSTKSCTNILNNPKLNNKNMQILATQPNKNIILFEIWIFYFVCAVHVHFARE